MNKATGISLLLITLMLSACGGGGVRGEAPLVSISSLDSDASSLMTRVDIHNPNDVDMELRFVSMSLSIEGVELPAGVQDVNLVIHPHGTEEIEIVFRPDEEARDTLASLPTGEGRGLAYTVDGEIRDVQGNTERFEHEGYFYPVPGKPGQFRGTGPQR